MHLRDLHKPIRQDYATAERAGIQHLGGIYCQEHAEEIAKRAIWALRLSTLFGYVGATLRAALAMLWEFNKAILK